MLMVTIITAAIIVKNQAYNISPVDCRRIIKFTTPYTALSASPHELMRDDYKEISENPC